MSILWYNHYDDILFEVFMRIKRFILTLTAALMLLFPMAVYAADSEETLNISVVTAETDGLTKLCDISVDADGLFCGWFTTEDAAVALDTAFAASDGYSGELYGAVLTLSEDDFSLVGVQMRTAEPYGIRFLTTLNKEVISTVESLSAPNRKGKNGTFIPANETRTGVGYGTVLAIDVETDGELTKLYGDSVSDGMCVPAVYAYSEDDSSVTYTATVLGVDTASLADKIAARPYITYADANGNERTYYYTESGSESGAYAASVYGVATLVLADDAASETDKTAASSLLETYTGSNYTTKSTISSFNLSSEEGSADGDNAYLELDRTTFTELSSAAQTTAHAYRYDTAYYTRTVKVNDNLYLLLFGYGQYGVHLYYATSTDGVTWGDSAVMYNAGAAANNFTYEDGALAGTTDTYYAVNADACVLDDGTILCVYSRRPNKGYAYNDYTGLNTIELVRGTVNGTAVTWSSPVSIYHGNNWEPDIIVRKNGDVEVYWSHSAPMLDIYGYQSYKRSSSVGMITSSDGGKTWTPNVTADDTNHYAAKRIYQQYVGDMTIDGEEVPFFSGQMPGVVELTNGRIMMVCEVEPMAKDGMTISAAFSDENGNWRDLAIDEEGPDTSENSVFKGAAPTLTRFASGEVLLTYNAAVTAADGAKGVLFTRVLNKEGSNIASATPVDFFGTTDGGTSGFWSSSYAVDSHTAILSMSYISTTQPDDLAEGDTPHRMIYVGKGRLNHTVNALHKNMVADGNLQEWKQCTEALFVGSDSAVQATFRFAYDSENVYVAIDRTDSSNNKLDTQYVMIATSDGYVKAEISYGDYTLPDGVRGGTKNAVGGRVYELAFDRAALGLTDDHVRVCVGVTDYANGTDDIINGVDITDTSTWLKVNLK